MKDIKGIILSGGSGSRLYPLTLGVSKQLLPIYNKPMIYYSLSVLMLANIKKILIITTPQDKSNYQRLLGDGSDLGIDIQYKIQDQPRGLAEAFIIGKDFINKDNVCLILGDNIFYGSNFSEKLKKSFVNLKNNKATIFGYPVSDPERYGVVQIDNKGNPIKIVEKPKKNISNLAVTGLYFYPNDVVDKVKKIKPSHRAELEITSVNELYLKEQRLDLEILNRGFAWLDMGTNESLIDASIFVKAVESRQGLRIACIEEIAYKKNFINKKKIY
jgi:glucose-1-phosphate thymidylyltransferase